MRVPKGDIYCMGITPHTGDAKSSSAHPEAVLAAMTRTLGPTHVETLGSRMNLAASYGEAGDLDRAARELEAVVEGFTATLGPRHAETLMARAYLGDTRLNLGDAQGAVALLEVAAPEGCPQGGSPLYPDRLPSNRPLGGLSVNSSHRLHDAVPVSLWQPRVPVSK